MPDTTILKTPTGWIDRDVPTVVHACRRLARDARRGYPRIVKVRHASTTKATGVANYNTATVTQNGAFTHTKLVGLQAKLYRRFRNEFLLSDAEAVGVIVDSGWGYNKAASYGHIRGAGASTTEASIVVSFESPDISLAYGQYRAAGLAHDAALDYAVHV